MKCRATFATMPASKSRPPVTKGPKLILVGIWGVSERSMVSDSILLSLNVPSNLLWIDDREDFNSLFVGHQKLFCLQKKTWKAATRPPAAPSLPLAFLLGGFHQPLVFPNLDLLCGLAQAECFSQGDEVQKKEEQIRDVNGM